MPAMNEFGVLPMFRGVAVHDHWKPYFGYTDCEHSLCGSHILRELKFVAEVLNETWAAEMSALLLEMLKAVRIAAASGARSLHQQELEQFEGRYESTIQAGLTFYRDQSVTPPNSKRGRPKQSKGKNLLDRLDKFRGAVLRFTNDFAVPFTNNQGEQDIRMNKVKQKISGCFRTLQGAEEFCRIRSYLSTARKQGHSGLTAMSAVIMGQPLPIAQPP